MDRIALTAFWRSLTRHRLYAAINIGGLAVGIAVFLVLGLYVRFETGYERFLPGHGHAYLLKNRWVTNGTPIDYDGSMGGLLEELRQDFPETYGARVKPYQVNVLRDGTATAEQAQFVDPTFLDVVAVPVVEGDGRAALRDPDSVLLSRRTAAKYFPGLDPIGQTMTLDIGGKTYSYRVAAVLADAPPGTELAWDIVAKLAASRIATPLWHRWGSATLNTYLRFDTPAAARAYASRFPPFIDRRAAHDQNDPHMSRTMSFPLVPIADVHLSRPGARLTVATLGVVGVLALVIAIINYVNLATARAQLRAREVAMRKVLGGSRAALVRQFLGEALLAALVAAVLGLAFAELALPVVNAIGGTTLAIDYATTLPLLGLLALAIGVGAGAYPALLLSRFPAAAVLASARSPGGGRAGARLREALVTAQFALTIAFLVATAVLFAQTSHVRKADLGFRRDGLVVVTSFASKSLGDAQRSALLAAFRALPQTAAAVVSEAAPGDESYNNATSVFQPDRGPKNAPNLAMFTVGRDWFDAYGVRLVAGRLLDTRHREDDFGLAGAAPVNVVLNRAALPLLGFRDPAAAVGRTVEEVDNENVPRPRTVVGVIDDIRFYSPRKKMLGAMYHYSSQPLANSLATVRVRGDDKAALDALRATWRRIAPQVPFAAKTVNQNLARYYKADDTAARLFAIGAVLAVAVGCVGLWGLASFNTARRVREIGIRKTLGASSTDIVRLLVTQFLRPVIVANLFAWPLAFLAMRNWLQGFDDRIALSPFYFAAATLLALVIAAATVLAQSLRAARATPAWALRHE